MQTPKRQSELQGQLNFAALARPSHKNNDDCRSTHNMKRRGKSRTGTKSREASMSKKGRIRDRSKKKSRLQSNISQGDISQSHNQSQSVISLQPKRKNTNMDIGGGPTSS